MVEEAAVVQELGFASPQAPVKRLIHRTRQAPPQVKKSPPSRTTRKTDFGKNLRGQRKDRRGPSSRNVLPIRRGTLNTNISDSELRRQDVPGKEADGSPLVFLG